jgi:hypothetical protein
VGAANGISAAEVLVALAVGAAGLAVSLPAAAHLRESGRAAAGARVLASGFAAARFKSVALHRSGGFYFERAGTGWTWREVEDGNGNGLLQSDIRSGTDRTISGPHRLEALLRAVRSRRSLPIAARSTRPTRCNSGGRTWCRSRREAPRPAAPCT